MYALFGRVCREPVLHFFVLAGLIFAADAWPRRNDVDAERITVSADFIRWLAESRARRAGFAPSRAELETIVQQHVEEEMLVREARRLALADSDPIVRRRIAQKMRFLFEDLGVDPPTDDELQQYFDAHADRYRSPPALQVVQVFLGATAPSPARVSSLRKTLDANPAAAVGRPLAIGRDLGFMTGPELGRLFSEDGPARVAAAPVGTWVGPLRSRFGYHLARVAARRDAELPSLSAIRGRVQADLLKARRERAVDAEMARLRERYEIEIEWPSPDAPVSIAKVKETR